MSSPLVIWAEAKSLSLHTSQVAHHARAYLGFSSMKQLGVFLLPLDGMLVYHRVTPSIKLAGTHLYTWVERGPVRVKCLAKEHNTMSLAEPGLLHPERSALTLRPMHLPSPFGQSFPFINAFCIVFCIGDQTSLSCFWPFPLATSCDLRT